MFTLSDLMFLKETLFLFYLFLSKSFNDVCVSACVNFNTNSVCTGIKIHSKLF